MPGHSSEKRQHARAKRIAFLRSEGISVGEVAKITGVDRDQVRNLQLLGERLLSLQEES